jgi:hypothetical protein
VILVVLEDRCIELNLGQRLSSLEEFLLASIQPPSSHLLRSFNYFKRLLEEVCPNHAYPVSHELKKCGMMGSFMTSASITWGAELDQEQDRSNTVSFPKKNAVMTVYGGYPHREGTACLA